LAERISYYLLGRLGYTPYRMVLVSFLLGAVLVFFIPQPFPRVIIMSGIYIQFLKGQRVDNRGYCTLLFSIYAASTVTSMMFLNGDVLLNYSVLQIGGINLSWMKWALYMTVPSLIIGLLMYLLFLLIFRKDLRSMTFRPINNQGMDKSLSFQEKRALAILISILALWMTEPLHSVNAAWISAAGAMAMYFTGLVEGKDLKKVNINLLLFLTAAFSIGGVLNSTGTAQLIFSDLLRIIPDSSSAAYYLSITCIIMSLHMFLGSAITTLSVGLPGLLSASPGGLNPIVITLILYTAVSNHYLLPFHHATIMIGAGENHYSNYHVIKYGAGMTALVLMSVLLIQLPWWRFLGLL